jgi:hypothetical protein
VWAPPAMTPGTRTKAPAPSPAFSPMRTAGRPSPRRLGFALRCGQRHS